MEIEKKLPLDIKKGRSNTEPSTTFKKKAK